MSTSSPPKGLASALALFLALPVVAQSDEDFRPTFTFRTGGAFKQQDNLKNRFFGMGIGLGFATPMGRLNVELGYQYKSSDLWFNPIGAPAEGMKAVNLPASSDIRRNGLDGATLRLGLGRKATEDLYGWEAGLQMGGTKFRHEYRGDVRSMEWTIFEVAPGTTPTISDAQKGRWRDVYYAVREKGGLNPSPYGSVSWKTGPRTSFALGLQLMRYTSLDYVHVPGGSASYTLQKGSVNTGNGKVRWIDPTAADNDFFRDRLESRKRLAPHVELAYTFHF